MSYPRKIRVFPNMARFKIDSIEVETFPVDHSLPGVCGFIIHTSMGSIGYTGDIRFHGRRRADTERFVDKCGNSDLKVLLCEGTRIYENTSKTESDVEAEVVKILNNTESLVVCSYPTRDLDRLLSFYNAAKQSGCDLVMDLKQAYILKLFQRSDNWRAIYPKPDDRKIKIYIPKKGWGLIDKDPDYWGKKLLLEDYDNWAVLIDEIEKMNRPARNVLLNLLETGIVTSTLKNDPRTIKLDTWMFATCNDIEKLQRIEPSFLSRLQCLRVDAYNEEQFKTITSTTIETGKDRDRTGTVYSRQSL